MIQRSEVFIVCIIVWEKRIIDLCKLNNIVQCIQTCSIVTVELHFRTLINQLTNEFNVRLNSYWIYVYFMKYMLWDFGIFFKHTCIDKKKKKITNLYCMVHQFKK